MSATQTSTPLSIAGSRSGKLLFAAWVLLPILGLGLYAYRLVQPLPCCADMGMFLTGAHLVAEGDGTQLYDLAAQTQVQREIIGSQAVKGGVQLLPFNYPPYVALALVPLSLLPAQTAYMAWYIAGALLLVLLAIWIRAQYTRWGYRMSRTTALALLGFGPAIDALIWGQMSVLLLGIWWWAFVSWRDGRWGQLGLATGLALFKPQVSVLLLAGLVAERRWRALLFAAGVQAVLWSLFLLFLGPGVVTGYLGMINLSALSFEEYGFFPGAMTNLRGLLATVGVPPDFGFSIAIVCWLLSIIATVFIWRSKWPLPVRFGATVLLAVLFSPHLYFHDATLLFLVLVCAELAVLDRLAAWEPTLMLAPLYALMAALYALSMTNWHSFTGAIVAVWLFGVVGAGVLKRNVMRNA